MAEDFHDDPGYQMFIEGMSKLCDCCRWCHQEIPCDSVMAGGFCDRLCECGNDDEPSCMYDEYEEVE